MGHIPLTQGLSTLVDDDIFDELNSVKWYAKFNPHTKSYLARRNIAKVGGGQTGSEMSRFITKAPKGMVVDHINHDTLDNRKANLRVCTNQENCRNKQRHAKSSSRFKGVYLIKTTGKWGAKISRNYVQIYLGCYPTEERAAMVYNEVAKSFHGEFAFLNKI